MIQLHSQLHVSDGLKDRVIATTWKRANLQQRSPECVEGKQPVDQPLLTMALVPGKDMKRHDYTDDILHTVYSNFIRLLGLHSKHVL